MLTKTPAIVLRVVDYGETSAIATLYTRTHGLLSFLVNGVRSAKSRGKASMLRPMSILELSCMVREAKNLQRIREMSWAHLYTRLPFDTARSTVAMFLNEVLTRCIREEEPNEDLFDFIEARLIGLDRGGEISPRFHIDFMLDFAEKLGFGPQGERTDQAPLFDLSGGGFTDVPDEPRGALSDSESRLMDRIIQRDALSRADRNEALHLMERYYTWHVEGLRGFRSIAVLQAVMG